MFDTFRKMLRRPAPAPCDHPPECLVFDWYRESGIATCGRCAEVFLVGTERAPLPDWSPHPPEGFDGA